MKYRVTLIKGDGIGPEVTGATCRVLEAAGAPIEWEEVPGGAAAVAKYGVPMPEETLASVRRNRLGLKGPLMTPKGKGFRSANVTLRQELELYVGYRPVRSLPGVKTPYENVDLVVLRENTEDLYAGIEHEIRPGVVMTLKVSTAAAGERIARWAFEEMRHKGRRKIACCHKASVVPLADGAFLDAFRTIGDGYPFIEKSDMPVDNLAFELALDPDQFDVLLLQNLYGDILSDLAAGLVGGLGVAPGANIGDRIAVFEAVHGTAPDIAGKGIANPLSVLLSALLMLEYVGETRLVERIERAVFDVLEEGRYVTGDLGGSANTAQFTDAIIDKLSGQIMSNDKHTVTLIPGDWIGPETCRVVQEVLDAAGAQITWDEQVLTTQNIDAVAASARNNGTVLAARVDAIREAGHLPPTVELRNKLGIWAAVRPVVALPESGARFPDLDLYVVRETSEDIYAGYEHEVTDGVFEAIKITTEPACERIARWAFYVARKHNRKRVTVVHKSNIMKKSDGLFLRTAMKVAEEFPDIGVDEVIVDALCMRLVTQPERFDVLLTGNLFGDIVSDLVSGLAGGITASATLSYGDDIAVFSNPHGRAEELVGRDLANPVPMLQTASYMLRHLGEHDLHRRLDSAIRDTLKAGVRTGDMKGTSSTTQVRDAVIARL